MEDFRREIHSIRAAVESIAVQNGKQTVAMQAQVEDLSSIRHVLEGNGSPGLIKLVDRHEQKFRSMSRAFWIVVGTVVPLVIGTAMYVARVARDVGSQHHVEPMLIERSE